MSFADATLNKTNDFTLRFNEWRGCELTEKVILNSVSEPLLWNLKFFLKSIKCLLFYYALLMNYVPAPWSRGLKGTMECGAGSITGGEGIFGQCMGSVTTQHREDVLKRLIFNGNSEVESQKRLETRLADFRSPLNWLDDLQLCL